MSMCMHSHVREPFLQAKRELKELVGDLQSVQRVFSFVQRWQYAKRPETPAIKIVGEAGRGGWASRHLAKEGVDSSGHTVYSVVRDNKANGTAAMRPNGERRES